MNCMSVHSIPALYQRLFAHFGPQHWWPCRSGQRWEIVAGAILTQNCAWTNVEKALDGLENAGLLDATAILAAPEAALRQAIRPAGFYVQKARYLRAVAQFFREHEAECLRSHDTPALREQLLAVPGVGRETADSILLYAFRQPLFVIDAYTRRIATRHLGLDGQMPYDELQRQFLTALPRDIQIYNEYHALIVALAKESCRKGGCGAFCQAL